MQYDKAAFDALIQQGLVASQADRVDEALGLFRRAAALVPVSGLPHFLIGAELAQLGQMDQAEAEYANAVVLAPDLLMARYQLGLIQFSSNRPALALVTWGPLFELPIENVLHHVVRGFAALAHDNFDVATASFQQAIALNHDNPALSRDLQMMLDRIATVQSDNAAATAANADPAFAAGIGQPAYASTTVEAHPTPSTPSTASPAPAPAPAPAAAEPAAKPAAEPAKEEETEESASLHVLLSNYQQQGPLH